MNKLLSKNVYIYITVINKYSSRYLYIHDHHEPNKKKYISEKLKY